MSVKYVRLLLRQERKNKMDNHCGNNIDLKLSQIIDGRYVEGQEPKEFSSSSLSKKLIDMKINSFVKELVDLSDKVTKTIRNRPLEIESRRVVYNSRLRYHQDLGGNRSEIQGKHFTWSNPVHMKTLVL